MQCDDILRLQRMIWGRARNLSTTEASHKLRERAGNKHLFLRNLNARTGDETAISDFTCIQPNLLHPGNKVESVIHTAPLCYSDPAE